MSKYRKQDIETMLRLQLGEAEKAKVIAQQTVERLEQQVAQLREEVASGRPGLRAACGVNVFKAMLKRLGL